MTNPTPPVHLIQVIRTDLERRGSGTPDDPHRKIVQFWTPEGELLAEVDRGAPTHCNAIGHLVRPGATVCERCGAQVLEPVIQELRRDILEAQAALERAEAEVRRLQGEVTRLNVEWAFPVNALRPLVEEWDRGAIEYFADPGAPDEKARRRVVTEAWAALRRLVGMEPEVAPGVTSPAPEADYNEGATIVISMRRMLEVALGILGTPHTFNLPALVGEACRRLAKLEEDARKPGDLSPIGPPAVVQALDLVARRFHGITVEYRRFEAGWDGPWRIRVHTTKNERSAYRMTVFGAGHEEAARRVLDEVATADGGRVAPVHPSATEPLPSWFALVAAIRPLVEEWDRGAIKHIVDPEAADAKRERRVVTEAWAALRRLVGTEPALAGPLLTWDEAAAVAERTGTWPKNVAPGTAGVTPPAPQGPAKDPP